MILANPINMNNDLKTFKPQTKKRINNENTIKNQSMGSDEQEKISSIDEETNELKREEDDTNSSKNQSNQEKELSKPTKNLEIKKEQSESEDSLDDDKRKAIDQAIKKMNLKIMNENKTTDKDENNNKEDNFLTINNEMTPNNNFPSFPTARANFTHDYRNNYNNNKYNYNKTNFGNNNRFNQNDQNRRNYSNLNNNSNINNFNNYYYNRQNKNFQRPNYRNFSFYNHNKETFQNEANKSFNPEFNNTIILIKDSRISNSTSPNISNNYYFNNNNNNNNNGNESSSSPSQEDSVKISFMKNVKEKAAMKGSEDEELIERLKEREEKEKKASLKKISPFKIKKSVKIFEKKALSADEENLPLEDQFLETSKDLKFEEEKVPFKFGKGKIKEFKKNENIDFFSFSNNINNIEEQKERKGKKYYNIKENDYYNKNFYFDKQKSAMRNKNYSSSYYYENKEKDYFDEGNFLESKFKNKIEKENKESFSSNEKVSSKFGEFEFKGKEIFNLSENSKNIKEEEEKNYICSIEELLNLKELSLKDFNLNSFFEVSLSNKEEKESLKSLFLLEPRSFISVNTAWQRQTLPQNSFDTQKETIGKKLFKRMSTAQLTIQNSSISMQTLYSVSSDERKAFLTSEINTTLNSLTPDTVLVLANKTIQTFIRNEETKIRNEEEFKFIIDLIFSNALEMHKYSNQTALFCACLFGRFRFKNLSFENVLIEKCYSKYSLCLSLYSLNALKSEEKNEEEEFNKKYLLKGVFLFLGNLFAHKVITPETFSLIIKGALEKEGIGFVVFENILWMLKSALDSIKISLSDNKILVSENKKKSENRLVKEKVLGLCAQINLIEQIERVKKALDRMPNCKEKNMMKYKIIDLDTMRKEIEELEIGFVKSSIASKAPMEDLSGNKKEKGKEKGRERKSFGDEMKMVNNNKENNERKNRNKEKEKGKGNSFAKLCKESYKVEKEISENKNVESDEEIGEEKGKKLTKVFVEWFHSNGITEMFNSNFDINKENAKLYKKINLKLNSKVLKIFEDFNLKEILKSKYFYLNFFHLIIHLLNEKKEEKIQFGIFFNFILSLYKENFLFEILNAFRKGLGIVLSLKSDFELDIPKFLDFLAEMFEFLYENEKIIELREKFDISEILGNNEKGENKGEIKVVSFEECGNEAEEMGYQIDKEEVESDGIEALDLLKKKLEVLME